MDRIRASLEAKEPIRGCYNISVGENDGVAFKMKKIGLILKIPIK